MDSPLRDMKKKKCCNHEWEGNINFGCSKGYNCECHRMSLQKESEWEEEFDKRFSYLYQHIDSQALQVTQHEAVKQFIRQEREAAYKDGYKKGKSDWKRIGDSREKNSMLEREALLREIVEEVEKLQVWYGSKERIIPLLSKSEVLSILKH